MTVPASLTYHLLRKEMSEVAEHYQELAAAVAPSDPLDAHRLRQMALLALKIVRSTDLRIADLAVVDGEGQ